jgi:hypothetical protein
MDDTNKYNIHHFSAPWCLLLHILSWGISAMFIAILVNLSHLDIPAPYDTIAILPLMALIITPPFFIIRGYKIDTDRQLLIIKRLGWNTIFSLNFIQAVYHDEKSMKSSIRLFGNGGLFSFTGLYRNKTLGMYRAYVNDPKYAVVIEWPDHNIVVTPKDPEEFVHCIKSNKSVYS